MAAKLNGLCGWERGSSVVEVEEEETTVDAVVEVVVGALGATVARFERTPGMGFMNDAQSCLSSDRQ